MYNRYQAVQTALLEKGESESDKNRVDVEVVEMETKEEAYREDIHEEEERTDLEREDGIETDKADERQLLLQSASPSEIR